MPLSTWLHFNYVAAAHNDTWADEPTGASSTSFTFKLKLNWCINAMNSFKHKNCCTRFVVYNREIVSISRPSAVTLLLRRSSFVDHVRMRYSFPLSFLYKVDVLMFPIMVLVPGWSWGPFLAFILFGRYDTWYPLFLLNICLISSALICYLSYIMPLSFLFLVIGYKALKRRKTTRSVRRGHGFSDAET